jgi:integrase/recombinase XerD
MVNRALLRNEPDLHRYVEELSAQKRSPHTVKNYALILNGLREFLEPELGKPGFLLREATAADLKQYQIHLVGRRQAAKNTLYIKIKAIQGFYRFLGLDVADGLKPPRRSMSLPKYLSEAEARRLLEACLPSARDHALLTLLLYSGLRVGEATKLTVEDIDFYERTVRVRSGKGDKDRLVVVTEKAAAALQAWLGKRPKTGSDWLFPGKPATKHVSASTVQRRVIHWAQKAGISKDVTPHILRHTLATTLLRKGGDIRFIQRILGHASIATTQIYTHLDDAELRRMYDRAQPDF